MKYKYSYLLYNMYTYKYSYKSLIKMYTELIDLIIILTDFLSGLGKHILLSCDIVSC